MRAKSFCHAGVGVLLLAIARTMVAPSAVSAASAFSASTSQDSVQADAPRDELVARNEVPRLPMFGQHVDYRETLAAGVVAPEAIILGGAEIRIGMLESAVVRELGRGYRFFEDVRQRTREQQWAYLRDLASRNDDSMHYYIISRIYYDLQLFGWFWVYEWTFGDLTVWVFLTGAEQSDTPHVWLLHLVPKPISVEKVTYAEAEHLTLKRIGGLRVRWDVPTNRVTIGPRVTEGRRAVSRDSPMTFYRTHEIEYFTGDEWASKTVTDTLKVLWTHPGALRFTFVLWHNNWHSCFMDGIALEGEDSYEYRERLANDYGIGKECILRIRPSGNEIVLEDVEGPCQTKYCGAGGYIGGIRFVHGDPDP